MRRAARRTRREFLQHAACAALGSQIPLFVTPSRAGAARGSGGSPLLVVVFLRGGADGLALLPRLDDRAFDSARAPLSTSPPIAFAGTPFGLHPALAPIAPLAADGRLAAVCAVGLPHAQRSHFEAQDLCERGGARPDAEPQGWLARCLAVGPTDPAAFRAVATRAGRPLALAGDPLALAFEEPGDLSLPGRRGPARDALEALFAAGGASAERVVAGASAERALARAGRDALDAVAALRAAGRERLPDEASFETGRVGRALASVARVARADLGLSAACVDAGGWDTHTRQAGEHGALADAARDLASGLAAFLHALESRMDDLLVLVVTEFGRSVEPNGSGGTDHGRASVALALGGAVAGGRVAGHWPGVAREQREDGRDLRVTTDVRDVLAEGARHLGASDLGTVFPGFAARAPGLLRRV